MTAERHARTRYAQIRPHRNDPNPDRRLRVGYVAADFRAHPTARFLEPVLEAYDRRSLQFVCYSDVTQPDEVTGRLKSLVDGWRNVAAASDERLAELIRADAIDVLVDLMGHMPGNRALLFASRPAPVQVSYIGYPTTTGLRTVDYRITDDFHDPYPSEDRFYTERLVRLPGGCWCYRGGSDLPAIRPDPPSAASGRPTFGMLNRLAKVTPAMLTVWAQLLQAVPGSQLLLLAPRGAETEPVWRNLFAKSGIDPARLVVAPKCPRRQFLELFNRVDVAVDTFPYNGHTTTCDALLMGVPTVTLAGNTHVSRAGLSVLSAANLESECVAYMGSDYVQRAADLASDASRLRYWRSTLRERVRTSQLADGARLAGVLALAYREMWRHWCATVAVD